MHAHACSYRPTQRRPEEQTHTHKYTHSRTHWEASSNIRPLGIGTPGCGALANRLSKGKTGPDLQCLPVSLMEILPPRQICSSRLAKFLTISNSWLFLADSNKPLSSGPCVFHPRPGCCRSDLNRWREEGAQPRAGGISGRHLVEPR